MFQTVGHNVIAPIAECMGVPLYRGDLHAVASQKTLEYDNTITKDVNENDEVEELYELLSRVKVLIFSAA
jgi:diphthine-ammonia ligase